MNFVKCSLCIAFLTLLSHELAVAQSADEDDFYFDDGSEVFIISTSKIYLCSEQ